MPKTILLISVLVLIFSSCVSKKDMRIAYDNTNFYKEKNNTSSNIDGIYNNSCTDKTKNSLSKILIDYGTKNNYDTIQNPNWKISLTQINPKKLEVQILDSTAIIQSFILKTKVYKNYVSIKKVSTVMPIPFFYFQSQSKIVLLLNASNQLEAIHASESGGWVVFMVAGNHHESYSTFTKYDSTTTIRY